MPQGTGEEDTETFNYEANSFIYHHGLALLLHTICIRSISLIIITLVINKICYKEIIEDIGTHSVHQLQAIGTQGRLCLDLYPVCVPLNENTACLCPNLRKVYGCVELGLLGLPVCVPYFDNVECLCHDLRTQCVCQTGLSLLSYSFPFLPLSNQL